MSTKPTPPKDLRDRYNAGIELVKDGMDPWLAMEHVLWPSKDVEMACAGELPPGWRWTPEGKRSRDKLEQMRKTYKEKKSAA